MLSRILHYEASTSFAFLVSTADRSRYVELLLETPLIFAENPTLMKSISCHDSIGTISPFKEGEMATLF